MAHTQTILYVDSAGNILNLNNLHPNTTRKFDTTRTLLMVIDTSIYKGYNFELTNFDDKDGVESRILVEDHIPYVIWVWGYEVREKWQSNTVFLMMGSELTYLDDKKKPFRKGFLVKPF